MEIRLNNVLPIISVLYYLHVAFDIEQRIKFMSINNLSVNNYDIKLRLFQIMKGVKEHRKTVAIIAILGLCANAIVTIPGQSAFSK